MTKANTAPMPGVPPTGPPPADVGASSSAPASAVPRAPSVGQVVTHRYWDHRAGAGGADVDELCIVLATETTLDMENKPVVGVVLGRFAGVTDPVPADALAW